jgi:8-oxo-dGTP pyrophosphatase MutT (NUDIX family)
MRQSHAAVALIRREEAGQTLWLTQWNPKWERFHFVSGHKRPDETFRQCLVREVEEELRLREGIDFVAGTEPVAHVEYTAWSENAKADTAYTMELFNVRLTGEEARRTVDADPENRWLTEAEIQGERCADGKSVSPTMKLLLSQV